MYTNCWLLSKQSPYAKYEWVVTQCRGHGEGLKGCNPFSFVSRVTRKVNTKLVR